MKSKIGDFVLGKDKVFCSFGNRKTVGNEKGNRISYTDTDIE